MPIQFVLQPLFPPFVAQHSVRFDWEDSTGWDVQFPGIVLPQALDRAVRKRQAEYLAGRHCVRETLRALNVPDFQAPVASGPHREPLWPPGIVGSITHTQGFASAAIARRQDARAIGMDAECIVSEEQARSLLPQIATPDEIGGLVQATGWKSAVVFTLVFSAKESIFKCLYPEAQRYFGFQAATVTGIDPTTGTFSARLLQTVTPTFDVGYVLHGTFVREATSIFTAMVLPP